MFDLLGCLLFIPFNNLPYEVGGMYYRFGLLGKVLYYYWLEWRPLPCLEPDPTFAHGIGRAAG